MRKQRRHDRGPEGREIDVGGKAELVIVDLEAAGYPLLQFLTDFFLRRMESEGIEL